MNYNIIGREKEISELEYLRLSQGIHNAPVDTQLTMEVLFKE